MINQPLDILAINESKLDDNDSDNMLSLHGYTLVRRDRNKKGGGVCVYLRGSLSFQRLHEFEEQNLELIALEIQKPNSKPFLFIAWYRPPKLDSKCFKYFELFLEKVEPKYKEIYLLGVLNCNFLSNPLEYHTLQLMDVLISFQMNQVLAEPTRVTPISKTLIDVVITNSKERLSHTGAYPLSISDHYLIYAIRKIGIPRGRPRFVEARNFKHFDESKFKNDLINATWPCIDNFQDVNRALTAWTKVFLSVVDKHAPCRTRRIRNKPSPWLNPNIKQLMFKRDWLKRKATKTGMLEDWSAYRTSRNLVNKEVRLAKKRFYQSRINEASGDQKATWKVLNDLLGKKSCVTKINELKSDCGVTITNPEDIADYMNKHFAAIGPNLASKIQVNEDNITPTEFLTEKDSSFNLKKVEASSVLKSLTRVKINKAAGIDKISNKILKIAAPVIYKNLTDLFNLSITSGVFPSDWKIAKVSPLFKSGDLNNANNYRPISPADFCFANNCTSI